MGSGDFLGELEQMVPLAILQCGDSAYAFEIRKRLQKVQR